MTKQEAAKVVLGQFLEWKNNPNSRFKVNSIQRTDPDPRVKLPLFNGITYLLLDSPPSEEGFQDAYNTRRGGITEKEQRLLDSIRTSDFQTHPNSSGAVWTWDVCEQFGTGAGGVVASAQKKGLIDVYIDGDDSTLTLTNTGLAHLSIQKGNMNQPQSRYCYSVQAWIFESEVKACDHPEHTEGCYACRNAGEYHSCKDCNPNHESTQKGDN